MFIDSAFLSGLIVACGFATMADADVWLDEVDADLPASDAHEIGFWAGTDHQQLVQVDRHNATFDDL